MTPTEIQALRRLLFFSRAEAARWVAASPERPAGVSDRAWRMWEDGERPIPAEVAGKMRELARWRTAAIDTALAQIARQPAPEVAVVWYGALEDWLATATPGREPLLWRPHQSVCAALLGMGGPHRIKLVPFDGAAYSAWLGAREDSEAQRAAWAARHSDQDGGRPVPPKAAATASARVRTR